MKTLSLAVSLSAVLATGFIFYDFVVTPLAPLLLSRRTHKAPPFTLNEVIRAAARKHGLRPAFIKSVIATESAFNQEAVSAKGAIGLMQLMPETAQEYGVDPHDPVQNVEGGAHLLSHLLDRYKGRKDQLPRAIAAYNAGPGNVDKYRGIPPFKETRNYVTRVLAHLHSYDGGEVLVRARSARPQANPSVLAGIGM